MTHPCYHGGKRTSYVSGELARGSGGFNVMPPDRGRLAKEFSIELCDGLPEHVENDPDYWIGNVGRFCPWSSFLREELVPLPAATTKD